MIALSARDRLVIDRARAKLVGARVTFAEAMRALHEATAEIIPDGRVFLLGTGAHGPIVGSLISGIGIADDPRGVQIVRAPR